MGMSTTVGASSLQTADDASTAFPVQLMSSSTALPVQLTSSSLAAAAAA